MRISLSFGAAVLVVGILPLFGGGAGAADVRGTVAVPVAAVGESSLNPYAGTLGSATGVRRTPVRSSTPSDVVVYVVARTGARASQPARRPRLVQRNQQFHPRVVGIPVGATVEFPNEDLVFHNVFSYSSTRRFDLGYYGKGKSKSVTFDKPGLVQVFCDIHHDMSAFIYVVSSTLVTQPDEDGRFALTGVPPGSHTIIAWHPEFGERRREVTVGDHAATVDIRF